jgi:hypothetical protein
LARGDDAEGHGVVGDGVSAFGELVRRYRVRATLSQEVLADALGPCAAKPQRIRR